ncbi:phosphatidylserine decarboxylase 1 [Orobanche minor]
MLISGSSLLGANSHLTVIAAGDAYEESDVEENSVRDVNQKSWWKISFASPKVGDTASSRGSALRVPRIRTELKLSTEYIVWNPLRLKLAATILCGVKNKSGTCVLIIGDICEITISHLSDLVGWSDGLVYVVGFSGAVVHMVEKGQIL